MEDSGIGENTPYICRRPSKDEQAFNLYFHINLRSYRILKVFIYIISQAKPSSRLQLL